MSCSLSWNLPRLPLLLVSNTRGPGPELAAPLRVSAGGGRVPNPNHSTPVPTTYKGSQLSPEPPHSKPQSPTELGLGPACPYRLRMERKEWVRGRCPFVPLLFILRFWMKDNPVSRLPNCMHWRSTRAGVGPASGKRSFLSWSGRNRAAVRIGVLSPWE